MAISNAKILDSLNKKSEKTSIPDFRTGDTVRVHVRIKEGTRERTQVFEGLVIKFVGGRGTGATFTVRKISFTVGVERTFYLHSPKIEKIEHVSKGDVRRARLFYLRDRIGKSARVKQGEKLAQIAEEVVPVETTDTETAATA